MLIELQSPEVVTLLLNVLDRCNVVPLNTSPTQHLPLYVAAAKRLSKAKLEAQLKRCVRPGELAEIARGQKTNEDVRAIILAYSVYHGNKVWRVLNGLTTDVVAGLCTHPEWGTTDDLTLLNRTVLFDLSTLYGIAIFGSNLSTLGKSWYNRVPYPTIMSKNFTYRNGDALPVPMGETVSRLMNIVREECMADPYHTFSSLLGPAFRVEVNVSETAVKIRFGAP